jgi:hypothetical protein
MEKEGASKAKSLTAAKEKPLKDSTTDKDTKKSTKKKLQSSAAKSDASRPSKSNTSEAMEMETPQRVVVQNGAHNSPALASIRNVELLAENLAFLRNMTGTGVKLAEDARTHSLLIYEIHAKAIQIVEDAMEKSSEFTKELRMFLDRMNG